MARTRLLAGRGQHPQTIRNRVHGLWIEDFLVTRIVNGEYKVSRLDLCTIPDDVQDGNFPCLRHTYAADLSQLVSDGILRPAIPGAHVVERVFLAVPYVGHLLPVVLGQHATDAVFAHVIVDVGQARHCIFLPDPGIQAATVGHVTVRGVHALFFVRDDVGQSLEFLGRQYSHVTHERFDLLERNRMNCVAVGYAHRGAEFLGATPVHPQLGLTIDVNQ